MKLKLTERTRQHVAKYAAYLSFSALVGCGGFELPTPPDMSVLVQEYENPDGELDGSNAMQLGAELDNSVGRLRGQAPTELMQQLVLYLQKVGGGSSDPKPPAAGSLDDTTEMSAGEQTVSGNKIDIGASVKLHHICRGWESPPKVDAAANGTVDINLALDRQGMLPTIWGYTDHCRINRNGTNIELTGDVRVHFGTTQPRIGLQLLQQIGYLVELDGTVKAMKGDQLIDTDAHITFRVFPDGRIHVKVDLPDGTNVVLALDALALAATDPMLEAGLVTRNVSWACKLNLMDVKGSCTVGADPNSVIQW